MPNKRAPLESGVKKKTKIKCSRFRQIKFRIVNMYISSEDCSKHTQNKCANERKTKSWTKCTWFCFITVDNVVAVLINQHKKYICICTHLSFKMLRQKLTKGDWKQKPFAKRWPATQFSLLKMLINTSNTATETSKQFTKLKLKLKFVAFEWLQLKMKNKKSKITQKSARKISIFYC